MHVDFDPSNINWYSAAGLQYNDGDDNMVGGGSASSFHYTPFSGMAYQRGSGVGSIFRSLLRYLMPLGKQAGLAIGRQGLDSTSRVLSSVLDGKQLGQSLADEGRTGLKNLLDKASQNLNNQGGSGGNFDFRRYKKHIKSNGNGLTTIGTVTSDTGTTGVFTQSASNNAINNGAKTGKHINNQLYSIIGPAQSKSKNKRTKQPPNIRGNKKVRIDSLGSY